jgi:4-amino-4-deoxy-L-arabinose transferase-like glycosyltransferase
MMRRLVSREAVLLAAISLLAFALRLAVRLYLGEQYFWENGYTFFAEISRNLVAGRGFALDDGTLVTFRVPGYPLFLAAISGATMGFLPIAVAQALVGTGTVLLSAQIARLLFGLRAGFVAAAITALYPYYIVHDTALQDTSLYTFLLGAAVLLLLLARRQAADPVGGIVLAGGSGLALALSVLTSANLAPFAAFAPIWLALTAPSPAVSCLRRITLFGICALFLAVALTPWLIRSHSLGKPMMLSGETGYFLWIGNNPHTFDIYPERSIDDSGERATDQLDLDAKAEIAALAADDRRLDQWYLHRALTFIAAHPGQALIGGFRKLHAAFGIWPSPRHGFFENLIYAFSYGPILILGVCGMWIMRSQWREQMIVYATFVSFLVVAAVFFGHTSYRAHLDVYLIVFASAVLVRFVGPRLGNPLHSGRLGRIS